MDFHMGIAGAALALARGGAAAQAAKKPASVLIITNNRAVPAVEGAARAGEAVVKLLREIAPKARATLKLPKMTGCTVAVAPTFVDESVVEAGDFDVCQERNVRFTDRSRYRRGAECSLPEIKAQQPAVLSGPA